MEHKRQENRKAGPCRTGKIKVRVVPTLIGAGPENQSEGCTYFDFSGTWGEPGGHLDRNRTIARRRAGCKG